MVFHTHRSARDYPEQTPIVSETVVVMADRSPADLGERTHRLASFVNGLTYRELPPEVVARVSGILLDTVGCAVGGSRTEPGQRVTAELGGLASHGQATIIGARHRVDPVTAAFANAWLSDVLDYEDTLLGHPSATAVPAGLAVGEAIGASGEALLTAIVAGYEVGVRVARSIWGSPERMSRVAVMHTWHAFPAAIAASKLLGLSHDQLLDAIGYAAASTPLPLWYGRLGRPMHWLKGNYGEMARAGVLAAYMGRGGVRAPHDILERDLGFASMTGSDRLAVAELDRELGSEWAILESALKPYPACRYIHSTLDAVRELTSGNRIPVASIDGVVVRSFRAMVDWFGEPEPPSAIDAQFSVPFLVALVLMNRLPATGWIDASLLTDQRLLDLASRVRLERDEECEALFASEWRHATKVEISTRGGRAYALRRDVPRGDPMQPLSDQEIDRKFLGLAEPTFGAAGSGEVLGELRAIAGASNVRPLVRRLGKPS